MINNATIKNNHAEAKDRKTHKAEKPKKHKHPGTEEKTKKSATADRRLGAPMDRGCSMQQDFTQRDTEKMTMHGKRPTRLTPPHTQIFFRWSDNNDKQRDNQKQPRRSQG